MRRKEISFGKKKGTWLKIVLICFAVVLAFFLGFVFGKPIMDIFR